MSIDPPCPHDTCDRMTDEELRRESVALAFSNLAQECRRIEQEHGFGTQSPGEDIALFHSEVSEALEEFRNGKPLNEMYFNPDKPTKPEGVPAELADVVIRILGFCARHNIDLGNAILTKMAYNETRPYRHGGKAL